MLLNRAVVGSSEFIFYSQGGEGGSLCVYYLSSSYYLIIAEATRPESTTDSPTTDSPTTNSPTTDSPTTDLPTTDLPTTDSSTTDSPATDLPTTDSSTTDSPTTDPPATDLPTTDSPTTYSTTTGFNFGYNNSYTCHCEDNTRCDTVTGDCSNGCFEGWSGPICQQENIALHSDFVNQSSAFLNDASDYGPKLAVDGDRYSCSDIDYEGGAWWFIDLQQQYSLRYMTLIYDAYLSDSAQNSLVSVHINDELCFQHTVRSSILETEYSVDCGRTLTGRSVNISFNIPDWNGDYNSMEVCEMEIFVCARGTYGSDCNNFCHCSNLEECDVKTGKCPNGCQLGWHGDNCNTVKTTTPEQTTDLSTTDSPTTDSPATDSPTTDSPTTDSLATDSPTSDSPATDSPTTDSPTTDSPTTDSPTTDSPTTDSPTTDSPTTDSPTTDSPTTDSPTIDSPTTDSPTIDSPTTDSPTSVSPTSVSPTSDSPTTDSPTTDLPATDSPATDSATTNSPTIDSPATDSPATDSSATDSPTTDSSTTDLPTTDSPATDSPTTDSLTTDSPTTDSTATDSPTTDSPTTDLPTTDSPTTDSPTTDLLTTDSPTTDSTTTDSPTTDSPATDSPTTDSPTTYSPTTDSPTTYSITTESIMCKKSTDSRNTTWSPVKAGTTSTNRCGKDYIGMSRRNCSEAGVWSQPDYSNCTRSKLMALKRGTEDVIEGKFVKTPNETLQMLADLTTDGPQLAAGDVEVSVQILKDVVDITNDDSQVVIGKPELENFAQSASNILDADDEEWRTLAEQGKSGIAVMMDIVDSMAKLSSSRLENNETITASTDKMIIEIGRSSLSDIEFPRPASSDYPEWLTQSSNKVVLRKESLGEQNISYNAVFYNDISKIVEGRILNPGETTDSKSDKRVDINSKILAVSINPAPEKLDPPLELSFQHLSDNYSVSTCVFLDLKPPYDKRGRWSTEGCKTESSSNPNVTICKCDHLTNFAILMSPGRTSIKHREVLSIISAVGCVISICCLLLTVFVYGYFWRYVKSDKAIILMNLCVTLIIAYIIFLGGVTRTDSKALCQTVAVLLHFFFLAVFFLMLAEGVQVLISVVALAMKSRLKWILLASWGIPTILVIISMIATRLHGYGNENYCWLSLESGLLWAFVGPALSVILINLIIVVKVLTVMFSTTTMVTKSMKEKGRTGLKALCVLLPIIGLTWVFGVFSVNGYTVVFQYLFAIFNSLQGLFIFIFHCVLNRQVNEAVKIRRRRYRAKSIDTGTGTKSSSFPMQSNQTRSMSDSDKPTNVPDEKKMPVQEAECQVHPQP